MSPGIQGKVTCSETSRGLADVLVSNGEQVVKTICVATWDGRLIRYTCVDWGG